MGGQVFSWEEGLCFQRVSTPVRTSSAGWTHSCLGFSYTEQNDFHTPSPRPVMCPSAVQGRCRAHLGEGHCPH